MSAEVVARAEALLEIGRTEDAIELLRQGLAADPDDPSLLSVLVRAQLEVDPKGAVRSAERLVALEPESSLAHRYSAVAFERVGDRDGAIRHARQAVALRPDDPYAHGTLATAIGGTKGKTQMEALQAAGRAMHLAPDATVGYFTAGVVELQAGRSRQAAAWFERVLEIDPHDQAAQINLAICNESSGHLADALGGIDGLLRFDPTDEHARRTLDEVIYTTLVHLLWVALFLMYVVGTIRGVP